MSGEIYLTREGYEKLMKELEHLKTTKRHEISKAIGVAREMGDISENAEYDAARDAQAHNELRISEMEEQLSRARILDYENIAKDEVLIGATVKLEDMDTGEMLTYIFVSELESDYTQNKICIDSPLGKGLLGHKKGEVVEVQIPAGMLTYKILEISR
ncbi:MAG: transcription elongation factor GreA [Candidatus Omnitrophota bacterium]|jgi:transcription elongation factor GreA